MPGLLAETLLLLQQGSVPQLPLAVFAGDWACWATGGKIPGTATAGRKFKDGPLHVVGSTSQRHLLRTLWAAAGRDGKRCRLLGVSMKTRTPSLTWTYEHSATAAGAAGRVGRREGQQDATYSKMRCAQLRRWRLRFAAVRTLLLRVCWCSGERARAAARLCVLAWPYCLCFLYVLLLAVWRYATAPASSLSRPLAVRFCSWRYNAILRLGSKQRGLHENTWIVRTTVDTTVWHGVLDDDDTRIQAFFRSATRLATSHVVTWAGRAAATVADTVYGVCQNCLGLYAWRYAPGGVGEPAAGIFRMR